jgi:hypothetical protein
MKRTSSWTTWNSSTCSVPRARKNATRRWTSSSGALAPEVMPTTRVPSSHSSRTCSSLSIRYDAAPCSRATSTRRLEFEELREPDDEHEVAVRGHLLDRRLAIGGGVADVVGAGTDDRREALAQAVDDRARLVDRQRGLRDVGELLGIGDLERVDVGLGLHQHDVLGRLAHRALDLLVAVVADETMV